MVRSSSTQQSSMAAAAESWDHLSRFPSTRRLIERPAKRLKSERQGRKRAKAYDRMLPRATLMVSVTCFSNVLSTSALVLDWRGLWGTAPHMVCIWTPQGLFPLSLKRSGSRSSPAKLFGRVAKGGELTDDAIKWH